MGEGQCGMDVKSGLGIRYEKLATHILLQRQISTDKNAQARGWVGEYFYS